MMTTHEKLTETQFDALATIMAIRTGSKSGEGLKLVLCEGLTAAKAAETVGTHRQAVQRQKISAYRFVDLCKIVSGVEAVTKID